MNTLESSCYYCRIAINIRLPRRETMVFSAFKSCSHVYFGDFIFVECYCNFASACSQTNFCLFDILIFAELSILEKKKPCIVSGAEVHIAEIDPVVISASVQAMGFPSHSVMTPSGSRAHSTPDPIQEVQWKGIHERIQLHESDAEKFLIENKNLYDLVFVDAYDGEDIFPHSLWDTHSPFLNALADQLHPEHGTVVVNLHSDVDFRDADLNPPGSHLLPMGKYISKVCRSYKEVLLGSKCSYNGLAYVVSVPWVCNTSLVVSRGLKKSNRDMVMRTIMSRSIVVENILDLPFSCMQYLKRGFTLVN